MELVSVIFGTALGILIIIAMFGIALAIIKKTFSYIMTPFTGKKKK